MPRYRLTGIDRETMENVTVFVNASNYRVAVWQGVFYNLQFVRVRKVKGRLPASKRIEKARVLKRRYRKRWFG